MMGFDEWIDYGMQQGFVKHIFDWVESGPELSEQELDKLENGDPVELDCVRIYRSES